MKKKMYSQKRFFRSFFPMAFDPQFLLFKNIKTGSLDIVVRSGDIIYSVPLIKGRDSVFQATLAKSIVYCFYDSDFDLNCDLCCMDQCRKYDIEDCYYSYDDDFLAIIHPYNPDAFIN